MDRAQDGTSTPEPSAWRFGRASWQLPVTGVTVATAPDEYIYDPWGEMAAVTEAVHPPLRYMARERDPITGLYYVRNRWYDPVMNRFVSEDPIGLAGGINTYAYVGNSPTNYRDPYGLEKACPPGFQLVEEVVPYNGTTKKMEVCRNGDGVTLIPIEGLTATARQGERQFGGAYIWIPRERGSGSFHEQERHDRSLESEFERQNAMKAFQEKQERRYRECVDGSRDSVDDVTGGFFDAKAIFEGGILLAGIKLGEGWAALGIVTSLEAGLAGGKWLGIPVVCKHAPGFYGY